MTVVTDETGPLRSTAWLADRLGDPTLRIVDGSFHLPTAGRNPKEEFVQRHIPGAVFFDIDAIADGTSHLPHMLPSADTFAERVGALGIGSSDTIVAYDAPGSAAAARIWWTFRVFGHNEVAILDGGLARWLAEGRPVEDGMPSPSRRPFRARLQSERVITRGELRSASASRPSSTRAGRAASAATNRNRGRQSDAATFPVLAISRSWTFWTPIVMAAGARQTKSPAVSPPPASIRPSRSSPTAARA